MFCMVQFCVVNFEMLYSTHGLRQIVFVQTSLSQHYFFIICTVKHSKDYKAKIEPCRTLSLCMLLQCYGKPI